MSANNRFDACGHGTFSFSFGCTIELTGLAITSYLTIKMGWVYSH